MEDALGRRYQIHYGSKFLHAGQYYKTMGVRGSDNVHLIYTEDEGRRIHARLDVQPGYILL